MLFDIFRFSPVAFHIGKCVCCFETNAQGRTQPSSSTSSSNKINRQPITPPAPIDKLAGDLSQLVLNNGAQAQVVAQVAVTSSGDSLSDWLQLQISNTHPGRTQAEQLGSQRRGRMIVDPNSWFNGEWLSAIGTEACQWADTTRSNPGTFAAVKACHFKTNHRPRMVYACSSCTVKHQANMDEVLDLLP